MSRFQPPLGKPLETWMKSPGALVTDADVASDRAISEALRRARVPGRVLSEESSAALSHLEPVEGPQRSGKNARRVLLRQALDANGLTWLIDPLCGTYPFSTGMVHWGVNIALRRGAGLELAALSLPALGETLTALRGKGVTRNGRRWSPEPRFARPSLSKGKGEGGGPTVRLSEMAVGLEIDGGETWRKLMRRGLGWVPLCGQINTFASAAYPMGQVCLGRLSALVIYGVEPVHLAAGAAIALELGLKVTDAAGEPVDWSGDAELPVVVAGWPEVHRQLIEAMGRS